MGVFAVLFVAHHCAVDCGGKFWAWCLSVVNVQNVLSVVDVGGWMLCRLHDA
ncbi:hypothetical protein [Bartonella sp. ML71XJBT]|uniref:hypothetical protein n=1 Tax=Bartonella sp. ML71XJBT TaxID=3019094 RepID=UPI0023616069|nr:hypothetical protein [Bartonella sp. ML71XJBT]